jgi:hypothetical protein
MKERKHRESPHPGQRKMVKLYSVSPTGRKEVKNGFGRSRINELLTGSKPPFSKRKWR